MTDLPQLQQALVVAARRRNRLTRARSAIVGLAAVAAVMVAASTALDGREREREVSARPQPSPVLTAREAADRFAVLRDESRLTKRPSGFDAGPGSQTYRIRLQEDLSYYVTVGERLCTAVAGSMGFGGGCLDSEELKDFAEGRLGVETARLGPAGGVAVFALVPDGTRDAAITANDDGITEPLPIKDNLVAVFLEARSVSVSWTTPDGERFTSRP